MKSLDKLGAGERAYIVDMQNSLLCEKLFEMGVFPGDLVEVKVNSKENNLLVVVIKGQTLKIYKPAAETIITNTIHFETSLN